MMSPLALRLCALRLHYGLSQKEVAQQVGISAQSCSHYETGRRTPDIYVLYRLCEVYQVTMESLIRCSDDEPASTYLSSLNALSDQELSHLQIFLEYLSFRRSHPIPIRKEFSSP